ncbi:hypothetical protein FACS18945_2190 [Bacteroidia bacterium]|nr:hypothetical protein FACS18945_2190 [Bacteroidia bacterium]
MAKKLKEIEVIDRGGAKTVARKTSWVKKVKITFLIFTILWAGFVYWAPLYVKDHYSEPIKKSIVVSMFFDLQRNINEQYEKLLASLKKHINLEKPIAMAIDKVKIAENQVAKVEDVSASAKKQTDKVSKLSALAGKFGANTDVVDNTVGKANSAIAKVDDTTKMINDKLDKVKSELDKVAKAEVDKMIDDLIKDQLDKASGGLGTTFLTNYGIKHVYPWRPSSWPVAVKIYNDLEKSNLGVIQILTRTVNQYFGYVAWGLVIIAWIAGLFIWIQINGKVKLMLKPFIVCPRCGATIVDKKAAFGTVFKLLTPWKWFS